MSLKIILYVLYYVNPSIQTSDNDFSLLGITIAGSDEVINTIEFSDRIPVFVSNEHQELNIYGKNITPDMGVGFTSENNCDNVSPAELTVEDHHVGHVAFTTPSSENGVFSKTRYYICMKYGKGNWTMQDDSEFGFFVYKPLFTPVILILILILTYFLSSLMTGLNIGLFTLDTSELELLKGAGTAKEKRYAKIILPVRRRGHFLLCSILITVTLCNSISTVTANQILPTGITVIITTISIVLLCEILPQSICTTYPLYVGANTIYFTKACMLLTAPVSYPLGLILDRLLGKETLLETYNKERLQELLAMTHLPTDEVDIISGTLKLSYKTVEEIMTGLSTIFKLPVTAVLDFETVALILNSGYSRIPIYVGRSSNIQYILLTKELALLDPQDKVPVKVVVQNTKVKCYYISKNTTVDKLLEIFKDSRSHMVFVVDDRDSLRKSESSQDREDKNEEGKNVIGLVTFEDVLEEIFQVDINDETDKRSESRIKEKIDSEHDLVKILKKPSKANKPSPNLMLALFKFLSEVEMFSKTHISPKVLRSLLNLDIYYSASGQRLPQDSIYVQGVPADYFIMIVEGQAEVKIGNEELAFKAGAFEYFGLNALKPKGTFIPDYMLQAVTKTTYIKISKILYEAAVLATQYENTKKSPNISPNSELYKYYQLLVANHV